MKVLLGFLQLCILFNAIRTIHSSESECNDDWVSLEASCFKPYACQDCTGNIARQSCENLNSNLAKVLSSEHQQRLLTLLNTDAKKIFLGARYVVTANEWQWPDGTVLDANNENWAPGESDTWYENCLYLNTDTGKWRKNHCREPLEREGVAYICEKGK